MSKIQREIDRLLALQEREEQPRNSAWMDSFWDESDGEGGTVRCDYRAVFDHDDTDDVPTSIDRGEDRCHAEECTNDANLLDGFRGNSVTEADETGDEFYSSMDDDQIAVRSTCNQPQSKSAPTGNDAKVAAAAYQQQLLRPGVYSSNNSAGCRLVL